MRELDWRIHEYMGNDLTGWEWYEYHEDDNEICKREANGWIEHFDCIPHYSTTWEGMRLVVEEIKRRDFDITIELLGDTASVQIGSRRPILGTTLPHAVCLAALQALEEDIHA
jgi:hypothetical protein